MVTYSRNHFSQREVARKLYFLTKIVLPYYEKKNVLVIESFETFLRIKEQFILTKAISLRYGLPKINRLRGPI